MDINKRGNRIPQHSLEFNEIIDRIPSKYNIIIITGLVTFILTLLGLAFFIKMPSKIVAPARITSDNPPVILKSHMNGKIEFLVDTLPCFYKANSYLAMIDNAASPKDVLWTKLLVDAPLPPKDESILDSLYYRSLSLGIIETHLYSFRSFLQEYFSLIAKSRHELEIQLLSEKIKNEKIILRNKEIILKNHFIEDDIMKTKIAADSLLFVKGVISREEYGNSYMGKMGSENIKTNLDIEIYKIKQSIVDTKLEKQTLIIEYERSLKRAIFNLFESKQILISRIKEWEDNYVLINPKDSYVELIDIVSNGDFVQAGQSVINLVFDGGENICIAKLPSSGAGDVKIGDKAIVKLDLYPYQEYGTIDGVISSISKNLIDNQYLVYIHLDKGLFSSNNTSLAFAETMTGYVEIITEEKRVIDLFIHKIHKLLSVDKKPMLENEENIINK